MEVDVVTDVLDDTDVICTSNTQSTYLRNYFMIVRVH